MFLYLLAICSLVKCPFNGVCSPAANGGVNCSCIRECSTVEDPVCGDDGKSYNNECTMKKWSCENRKLIKVNHKGRCGKFIPKPSSERLYII